MTKPSSPPTNAPAPIAEINHGLGQLDELLDKHQKKLVTSAILIALGVILYIIWNGLTEAEAQKAGNALLTAETTGNYQDVIKKWPDSNSAASAFPLLANLQWEKSPPESIETLREFIRKHPKHPSLATAKVSLGLCLLAQGKPGEARKILTEVTNSTSASYITPLAYITLGDIAKATDKGNEAKTWYEQALEDPTGQGNSFKNTAIARLALVNAKPPTKIKPTLPKPPKPPASPGTPAVFPSLTPPEAAAPEPPETPQTPTS